LKAQTTWDSEETPLSSRLLVLISGSGDRLPNDAPWQNYHAKRRMGIGKVRLGAEGDIRCWREFEDCGGCAGQRWQDEAVHVRIVQSLTRTIDPYSPMALFVLRKVCFPTVSVNFC